LPDHQINRKVSATDSKHKTKRIHGGGASGGLSSKRKGIHMPDGSVWTGYYSELKELPADMFGTVRTPAASHLFDVNDDTEKLNAELSDFFHHNVAKLLFLCKRARPDIQTVIAFLCTRVKEPDVDDKKTGQTPICEVIQVA
jgi:hypothetical protein